MKVISVIHDEFKTIAGSYAILLVLMGGIFVYGLLYNYMYAPDLVRKVPVAVVDHSHSELSRHYVRLLDATPQVNVVTTATGYPEAQDMMKSGRVAGILYLPDDFEDRVARGEESVFIMYETTSAFLYYLAMQEASAASMLALNDDYRPEMLVFLPKEATTKLASAQAVEVVGTALYNPTEGYGTYLIPSVLVVIIFQTLMMVIAMISGDERHSGLIVRFAGNPVNLSLERMAQVVIGKTFVYGMLYAVFALFLLGLIPLMFGLPDIGNPLYVIMLMIPFLLATSFFRAYGVPVLYGLRCAASDDRLLFCRPHLSFRCLIPDGTDALVLEIGALSHPGSPGDNGLCQAELDGGFDERDTTRIYYLVGTVHILFCDGMFGL